MTATISKENICYEEVSSLAIGLPNEQPELPDAIYPQRLKKVRAAMELHDLECLVIYGEREHFANFHYLAGFEPRFEEGLLIVHRQDPSYLILGHECIGMYKLSKIDVRPLLYSNFALPNTPPNRISLMDLLQEAGLASGMKTGVIGWKLFTSRNDDNPASMYDLPAYIIKDLIKVVGEESLITNATPMFVNPEDGIRVVHDADEIAVFEYGAALASAGIASVMNNLQIGMTELELAGHIPFNGAPLSCHPVVSTGAQAWKGLISPTSTKIQLGDAFTTCVGFRGGLTCRAGYVAHSAQDLPAEASDYLDAIVKPYYAAVASWYERIGLGVTGKEMYDTVQSIFPKEKHGWVLNPGHLISAEEWLSSPNYTESNVKFRSGNIVQMDIIPGFMGPYYTANVEDGVVIADEALRDAIRQKHPEVWARMQARHEYMKQELGIDLKPEVLPMSNLAGLYRPFLLNKTCGVRVKRNS